MQAFITASISISLFDWVELVMAFKEIQDLLLYEEIKYKQNTINGVYYYDLISLDEALSTNSKRVLNKCFILSATFV